MLIWSDSHVTHRMSLGLWVTDSSLPNFGSSFMGSPHIGLDWPYSNRSAVPVYLKAAGVGARHSPLCAGTQGC